MAYGFIEADVIRDALTNRVDDPVVLSKCLDLMCDYILVDMVDEGVPHEVWAKRDTALTLARKTFDRKEYGVCLAYIDDYFAI